VPSASTATAGAAFSGSAWGTNNDGDDDDLGSDEDIEAKAPYVANRRAGCNRYLG
jgi:hypothetical protein